MRSFPKYLRLYFEGSILLGIIVYFFGPVLNSHYSVKKLDLLWVLCMVVLTALSKLIIPKRDELSMRKESAHFLSLFDIRKNDWYIMLLLFVAGLTLRFVCVQWNDASHIFQPDEGKLVEPAIMMTKSWLNLYSDYFTYPNQFVSKIAAILLIAKSKLMHGPVAAIPAYMLYRRVVSVFGALAVVPAYMIGNRLWQKKGWVLGAFAAFFPTFIKYSVQVTGDIPGFTFQLCVLAFSIAWFVDHKKGYAILMGLFAGMSTLEKWHNGVICIYIALIVIAGCRKSIKDLLINGITALLSWVAGLLIFAPNILWHIRIVIAQFITIWNYPAGEKGGRWDYFLTVFYSYSGLIMVIATVFGLIYCITKHERDMAIVIGGLINYFVMNLIMNRLFERWACLFYFTMLVFAFYGVKFILEYFRKPGQIIAIALTCLWAVVFIVDDAEIVTLAEAGRVKDTRFMSEEVLAAAGIDSDNTINGYYTTFAPGGTRAGDTASTYVFMSDDRRPFAIDGNIATVKDDSLKYLILSDSQDVSDVEPVNLEPIYRFESGSEDLFYTPDGRGWWFHTELNTIICSVRKMSEIINAQFVGPTISVYDISNGTWEIAQ